jgi:glycosyltransferase involved in cell wall biosynthesis
MKIVLDLQGAQSETSRVRGIGRYSMAFAGALAREAHGHEIWLVLSARFADWIEPVCAAFINLIPPERIRIFESVGPVAEVDPANTWRTQAAELLREKFLADLHPDIVHVSSMCEGAGNEAVVSASRLNRQVPTTALLHDLIPLLNAKEHLSHPGVKRSYLRHVQSLRQADLLLANSESSRREAIRALQIYPERVKVIGAGLARQFQKNGDLSDVETTAFLRRHGLVHPFVLYAGAIDRNKNVEGLLAAFVRLPNQIRATHQLALAGKVYDDGLKWLNDLVVKYGFKDGEMVRLGFVPDDELRLLYHTCAIFVFPSFHEGFGLPVLEAMACGAAVLGSNCTSIPEIIDRKEALFDPRDPQAITERIEAVLTDAGLRESLKRWGPERARGFTWEKCARKALEAFETLHAERKRAVTVSLGAALGRRPLLAFVSPLPPEPSVAAEQSARLLPNLTRHYEIVCIVDQPEVSDPWLTAEFAIRDLGWFETHAGLFERIVYQLASSMSHKHIFALLERYPGVTVLHDFDLSNLLKEMADAGCAAGNFSRLVYDSHGFSALGNWPPQKGNGSTGSFPCNAAVLRDSIGVIVNSEQAIEWAKACYGEQVTDFMRQAPSLPREANPSESLPNPAAESSPSQKTANDLSLHPERIAERYRDLIEELYATSPQAGEQRLIQAIARISALTGPSQDDLAAVANALAANRERFGPRQLLIDVSVLAESDAGTGIQRVTRAILMALISDPPSGYRIEPIRAVKDGGYVYARQFTWRCLGLPQDSGLADESVETAWGDLFLGLDLCYDLIPEMAHWFETHKRRGMQIVFVIYDLLSLGRPHQFYPQIPPAVRLWLNTLANISDGLVCISRAVADEVQQWLDRTEAKRRQPLQLGFFHLGANLRASLPSTGLSPDASMLLERLRSRASFLMVGTLEPRKGHEQALQAMELLWAQGLEANLVIIGKEGWMVGELVERLKGHAQRDRHLFWLQGVSDEMLEELYRSSRALLAASQGEGFGLPLIEAAQYGLPIIARDLPVFREVAGEHAYYFQGEDREALANALRVWLSLGDAIPNTKDMPWLTWHQSSRQLLKVIINNQWYSTWPVTYNSKT